MNENEELIEVVSPEEEIEIGEYQFVSGGDSFMPVFYVMPANEEPEESEEPDPQLQELIEQMNTITQLMEAQEALAVDYRERESMSIWEKPLEQYTVTESVTTLLFFSAVVVGIFGLVGGIIKWRK